MTSKFILELKDKKKGDQEETSLAKQFKDYKKNKNSLLYPSLFFSRRYALLLTLTTLHMFPYAQILSQIILTMSMITYMLSVKPFISG